MRRKEKALAEPSALLLAAKKIQAFWGEDPDDRPKGDAVKLGCPG